MYKSVENPQDLRWPPIRANRFADSRASLDSRDSFQGSRTEPRFCESRFGGAKVANRRFQAIRANRSHVMKTGFYLFFLRIGSRESIHANRPDSRCESPGHLSSRLIIFFGGGGNQFYGQNDFMDIWAFLKKLPFVHKWKWNHLCPFGVCLVLQDFSHVKIEYFPKPVESQTRSSKRAFRLLQSWRVQGNPSPTLSANLLYQSLSKLLFPWAPIARLWTRVSGFLVICGG